MFELCSLTIAEASRLIRRRKLSPVEFVQAHLDRIERLDTELRSFITVTAQMAMDQAKQAAEEIARGRCRGPLHGIPVSYKDIIATAGIRTTAASRAFADWIPDEDAGVVVRLRNAGAITLGKANLYELAWTATSEDHLFKPARNPWNAKYPTEGSSTGSAAAVAAGLTMASIATDSGGSIRNPSAFCGVTGLKPTYGRVSRRGIVPLSYSLDTVGPIARTAEETAILLQALAGYDRADRASSREPVPDYHQALSRNIRGIKVGICPSYIEAVGVDVDVMSAFEDTVKLLRSLGLVVAEITIPYLTYAPAVAWTILRIEGFHTHFRKLRDQRDKLSDSFFRSTAIGGFLSAQDYIHAQQARALISENLAQVFHSIDLMLMPTNPKTASPATYVADPTDSRVGKSSVGYVTPFNLNGSPAISLQAGFNSAGMPIGIQLAGRPYEESTLLAVAHKYQLATKWHQRKPPLDFCGGFRNV